MARNVSKAGREFIKCICHLTPSKFTNNEQDKSTKTAQDKRAKVSKKNKAGGEQGKGRKKHQSSLSKA